MKFLYRMYRCIIPMNIRKKLDIRQRMNYWMYVFGIKSIDKSTNEWQYIKSEKKLSMIPYEFKREYDNLKIEYFEKNNNNKGVIHNGRELYFPETFSQNMIITAYKNLIIEQDSRSPHKYFNNDIIDKINLEDYIFIDVGAAEGIISLDLVDQVSSVIIYECDEKWITALENTFRPWNNKIKIIRKFASNINDSNNEKIDERIMDEYISTKNIIFKMDIEGYEKRALDGMINTLNYCKNVVGAICTYHRENDAIEIKTFFDKLGFGCEFTDGLLYVDFMGKSGFRKGVLKVKKISDKNL